MSVEMVFQVIKASELLVAMLAGKRFLAFVYVQVPFVSGEVVELLVACITLIWTVTCKDI